MTNHLAVLMILVLFPGTPLEGFSASSSSSFAVVARAASQKNSVAAMTEVRSTSVVDGDIIDNTCIPRCYYVHPTFERQPLQDVAAALAATPPTPAAEQALASLAAATLALLAGDEAAAEALVGNSSSSKRELIEQAFRAYDVCESGRLSVAEARALFVDLARNMVTDLATPSEERRLRTKLASYEPTKHSVPGAARAHAQRVLNMDESGNTIERIASKLLVLADEDQDGKVSLDELAKLFDTVYYANRIQQRSSDTDSSTKRATVPTFPQPLRALAGSLQLVPAVEGNEAIIAASRTLEWNIGVPGDDHTLRRVELETNQLSIVGLGRSADASSYFLPELGIVLDAGIHVKSIRPKTVLLTHGHRDHIAALPTHAAAKAKILCPEAIAPLLKRYLLAEAQLNFGAPQTDEQTIRALGEYHIQPVKDGDQILLPREAYQGSPTPIGVQVFRAPHKEGVPAVSYGLYRVKSRLKAEYASLPKRDLGALIQQGLQITENYNEGILFYTGDTTINLLKERWREILPKYKHFIHEVTFLGKPSAKLDEEAKQKGHTHYSQLHPWICAFPDTTFVCVHWSLRYSRQDILQFFQDEYGGVPKNVVLWV